jgi:hypothetical protein
MALLFTPQPMVWWMGLIQVAVRAIQVAAVVVDMETGCPLSMTMVTTLSMDITNVQLFLLGRESRGVNR